MNDFQIPNGAAALPAPSPADLVKRANLQRGFGLAILNAKPDCCRSCDFLRAIVEQISLDAVSSPAPVERETPPAPSY